MAILKNFSIRSVMLWILGVFCLLWSGVGLYSVHALGVNWATVTPLTVSWCRK